jgi:hypothetical protein
MSCKVFTAGWGSHTPLNCSPLLDCMAASQEEVASLHFIQVLINLLQDSSLSQVAYVTIATGLIKWPSCWTPNTCTTMLHRCALPRTRRSGLCYQPSCVLHCCSNNCSG